MKAIIFDGNLKVVNDYPIPTPKAGEVLVHTLLSAICNTDLEIIKGYANFHGILGHEFVGELPDGTRVVGEINTYDGTCSACLRGDFTHCENRTTLGIHNRNGTMAEYFCLPEKNLHPLPASISNEEAVFTEPLAAAIEIAEQVHIKPTHHVAVVGDGKLGILCAQVLRLFGCSVTAIGHHPSKLALLKLKGIETHTDENNLKKIFDVVIEATGNPNGFALAQKLVHPRGKLILKSTFHGQQTINLSPLVVDEIQVIGSRCGPFPPAIRMLEQKLVDVKPMISAILPLSEGEKAFALASAKGMLKILLSTTSPQ